MIAKMAGLFADVVEPGRVKIEDPVWDGYLANVRTAEFEARFAKHLPASITGGEFLDRYHGVTDQYSIIHREREYPVRAAAAHPVYENARVRRFAELLKQPASNASLGEIGEIMYSSHHSYSSCGLGSDGTDMIVSLVRDAGIEKGLLRSKDNRRRIRRNSCGVGQERIGERDL